MKRNIQPFDYANEILTAVRSGVLMTVKAGEKVNPMSISWGTMGIQWGLPIFTVFVRGCRHTSSMLDENPEFTVNIPLGAVDKEIIRYCGTKSGRDTDKIADLNLHIEEPEAISVPGIRELPLTLECKVIYRQDQDLSKLEPGYREHCYPTGTAEENNFHTAYYGEITAAYILED